jgi:hypothetical protein
MVTRSWGHCPVRFICPNDVGYDLTIVIREQLIDYYVKREFETGGRIRSKPVVKKQQKTVAQKAKKMVDKQPKE